MLRSIYGKLSAIWLGLFYAVGFLFILGTLFSNRMYFREANQRLNRNVAKQFVSRLDLLPGGHVDREAFDSVSRGLMAINPEADIYLLDPDGRILASSVPGPDLAADRVAMEPVHRFSQAQARLPILGDNPRDPSMKRVFSACSIPVTGHAAGYLYITLGGGEFETIPGMLRGSYIVGVSVFAAAASLLLVLAVGLLLFHHLTRRLRSLSEEVETFQKSGLGAAPPGGWQERRTNGDEIDRLQSAFRDMALTISDQVRELTDSDSLRRELLTNVSHDLRTPLTSLQGYLETLAVKQDLTEREKGEYLDRAIRQSNRLRKLIADLFELAKLDACEVRAHLEPFSLGELALDVLQKFQLMAEGKGIRLAADLDPDLPFVMADIGLMERALENLIRNAIQYTPPGGTVSIGIVAGTGHLTLEVADTGKGIGKEDLPLIFDRYYRGDLSDGEAVDGTGLGLAITKRIVELHESVIYVRSETGLGTVFSFQLPVPGKTG